MASAWSALLMKRNLLIAAFLGVLLSAIIVTVVLVTRDAATKEEPCYYCTHANQSKLGEICSPSPLGRYKRYAISTDSNVCAPAGKSILEEGGNAIDAAISVLLCMGVTIPESLGLGGGSLSIIRKANGQAFFINGREMAPGAAHRDMYNQSGKPDHRSAYGVEAIGVPGELAAYWHIYTKYGSKKVTWTRLFRDAIKFAEDGFPVGHHFQEASRQNRAVIMRHKSLRDVYVNPATGDLYRQNEIFRQPALATTLRNLSEATENAHDYFYRNISALILNDLYQTVANEFPNQSAILQMDDFLSYRVLEEEALNYQFSLHDSSVEGNEAQNLTLHTTKLPGGGPLLAFILRVMRQYDELYPDAKRDEQKANLFYHRLIEAYKYAFANRMFLGDDRYDNVSGIIQNLASDDYVRYIVSHIDDNQTYPSTSGHYYDHVHSKEYQRLDHGTAHVSVLDEEGNAVAFTTSVNLYFGSKVMSPSTGLILNDQMDDFNIGETNQFDMPVSFANTVHAYKRPLSSMSPAIFTDNSGVRLVVGASGGPKILTSVAYTAFRHLWFGDNIKTTIDACRLHDQLFPDSIIYERCFPDSILKSLRQRKHNITQLPVDDRGAIVMAITRSPAGVIEANSDFRKGGTIAGL